MKKRMLKIRWRILFYILPVAIALFFLMLLIMKFSLYYYAEKEKIESNDLIITQLARNLNEKYIESSGEIESKTFIENDIFNEKGAIYILDKRNELLYSNSDIKGLKKNKTIDQKILQEFSVDEIIKGERSIKVINTENGNIIFSLNYKEVSYITFLYDTGKFFGITSGLKILYFLPKDSIYIYANNILASITLISGMILVFVIFISLFIGNTLIYPLKKLTYAIDKVTQGYLDLDVISGSKDEIGRLYRNFRRMIRAHIDIISNVQKSSNDITGYQKSLSKMINEFNNTLTNQESSIINSSTKYEELDNSILKVVQNVKDAQGIISQAQKHSSNSSDIINDMLVEINSMAETGQEINVITELINGISERTRLLSVNSAIEASRAGEAGKGFSVVATEIKKLASQSKDAANQIGELIKMNDKRIASGVNKTQEVIEALNNISSSIKMITDIVEQINMATQEESRGSRVIMNINSGFAIEAGENIKSIASLAKLKDLLNLEMEKMRTVLHAFILKSEKKEIINDIMSVSKEEKNKQKKDKKNKKIQQRIEKKEIEEKQRLGRIVEKGSSKLDTVRAISLYKPKEGPFGLFRKK